jgi:DNA repair photolyase
MTYYKIDSLAQGRVLSARRPTINEFFLSSYTMSIYHGCEFGCPYCDGWVYQPHLFSEEVRVPGDLPQRLASELETVNRGDLIAITALSDPYQPAERSYRITRQVLQLFAEAGQPCLLLTKNPAAALDDVSLLQRINEQSLAIVMTTLVTHDYTQAERLEGKAPPPPLRLEGLAALKRAGIPVGVAMVPVMPYVNDTNYAVQRLMRMCADAQVDFVIWDYLYIPNRSHRARINDMLTYVGNYPPSYYRDIYRDQPMPHAAYRDERNREILRRCDALTLPPHVPHRFYAGRLAPANEAALVLKHAALRNAYQGQHHMAALHRELADQVYHSHAMPDTLRASPLWHTIRPILNSQV